LTIGDIMYGFLPRPRWLDKSMGPRLQNLGVECLLEGTVITVESKYLDEFISDVHPNIKVSYIGLSCDSDPGLNHATFHCCNQRKYFTGLLATVTLPRRKTPATFTASFLVCQTV